MTVKELARRIDQSVAFTQTVLNDWMQRGIAHQVRGRWFLTDEGFDNYGRAILAAEQEQT